jgi:hypothetical protein
LKYKVQEKESCWSRKKFKENETIVCEKNNEIQSIQYLMQSTTKYFGRHFSVTSKQINVNQA